MWTRDGKRAKSFDGDKEGLSLRKLIDEVGDEIVAAPDYGDWLEEDENPIGTPTEREVQNAALGLPVYRSVFTLRATDSEA